MSVAGSIMYPTVTARQQPPESPTVLFTLDDQPASVRVLKELGSSLAERLRGIRLEMFESAEAAAQFFEQNSHRGFRPGRAVALFDHGVSGCMKHTRSGSSSGRVLLPDWASRAKWGVAINPHLSRLRERTVANQVAADYGRCFTDRVVEGQFPWGKPRRGESGPADLALPVDVVKVVDDLNSGIDFLSDVDPKYVASLPPGSRISCNRVAAGAYGVDVNYLEAVMRAFVAFEQAGSKLVGKLPAVRQKLLDGVQIDPELEEIYLFPARDSFSVRRLDVHLKTPTSVFASENDEMPGGLAHAWWYDRVYGVNQQRWEQALEWLTSEGPLLFLVSNGWGKPYLSEMREMAVQLRNEGHPVDFLATDQLEQLTIAGDGLRFNGKHVGTIWRQFPVFEVQGQLSEIVKAAHAGLVRMVPEFAHFGNKSWFSLFREHQDAFQLALDPADFKVLDEILPDTALVQSDGSFPPNKHRVGEVRVSSVEALKDLPVGERNQLVLKVAGANELSARSYGVLMGHNLQADAWQRWIDERIARREAFIIQTAEPTEVRQEPVYNTSTGAVEMFACRMLLRPWAIGDLTVSGSIVGATATTRRVHGMTDMFIVPTDLGQ